MRNISVKVHPSKANLKKKDQLAWKIAEIASDKAKINSEAIDCLLYTSPSPRDGLLTRMPSSA